MPSNVTFSSNSFHCSSEAQTIYKMFVLYLLFSFVWALRPQSVSPVLKSVSLFNSNRLLATFRVKTAGDLTSIHIVDHLLLIKHLLIGYTAISRLPLRASISLFINHRWRHFSLTIYPTHGTFSSEASSCGSFSLLFFSTHFWLFSSQCISERCICSSIPHYHIMELTN